MQRRTTRQYFEESLLELVEFKPFERITVRDIAKNCGMTTRTFYNYFQDKYDLILWTYSSRFEWFLAKYNYQIDFFELFSYLADFILERRKLYTSALQDTTGIEGFMDSVIDYSCWMTLDYIRKNIFPENVPEELEFSVRFFYQGGFHIGLEYLKDEVKMTKEHLLECILNSVPDNLKPYLELNTTCRKM